MTNGNPEKIYGKALFLLAEEEGTTEVIKDDMSALGEILRGNPEYTFLLDSPAIPAEERCTLVEEAFGSFARHTVNLIKILAQKRLSYLIPKIIVSFIDEYDVSRGNLRVEAVTAVPMSEEQIAKLAAKLEKMTGKQIIVRNTQDKKLLGGIQLRYGGIQLDSTVKTRLETFKKRLSEVAIQ